MQSQTPDEIDGLLAAIRPSISEEADLILDLRTLLKQRGHPGKCVRCFFALFELSGTNAPIRLFQLQTWLENHLELRVTCKGKVLECIPFKVKSHGGLEDFCRDAIQRIRMDRSYNHPRITIGFHYREALAA